ncbi:MAG: hypothetical protein NVS4B6_31220 [Mycobacterium sp.]
MPGALEDALEPPEWFIPFENMQAIAEELRCSVMEAAEADPEWREMATVKLLALAEAKRRNEATASESGHS